MRGGEGKERVTERGNKGKEEKEEGKGAEVNVGIDAERKERGYEGRGEERGGERGENKRMGNRGR